MRQKNRQEIERELTQRKLENKENQRDEIMNYTGGGIVSLWIEQKKQEEIDSFLKNNGYSKICSECYKEIKGGVKVKIDSSCNLYDNNKPCEKTNLIANYKEHSLDKIFNEDGLFNEEIDSEGILEIKKIKGEILLKKPIKIE